jgi:hypothetical protein
MLKPHYLIIIAVILVLMLAFFWPRSAAKGFSLGECLTQKGVVMYGSDMCEECKNQKTVLGKEFNKINYVNCDFKMNECRKKGITIYPIWSLDNNILVGEQTADALADFAGCKI